MQVSLRLIVKTAGMHQIKTAMEDPCFVNGNGYVAVPLFYTLNLSCTPGIDAHHAR